MAIERGMIVGDYLFEIDSEDNYPSTYEMLQKVSEHVSRYYVSVWTSMPEEGWFKGYGTTREMTDENGNRHKYTLIDVAHADSLLEASLYFNKFREYYGNNRQGKRPD